MIATSGTLTGRTALITAHRLSAVAIADLVLVLRSGRVIEDGSAAERMGGADATAGEWTVIRSAPRAARSW